MSDPPSVAVRNRESQRAELSAEANAVRMVGDVGLSSDIYSAEAGSLSLTHHVRKTAMYGMGSKRWPKNA